MMIPKAYEVKIIQTIGRIPAFFVILALRVALWIGNAVIGLLAITILPFAIGALIFKALLSGFIAPEQTTMQTLSHIWLTGVLSMVCVGVVIAKLYQLWNAYNQQYPAQKKDKE